MKIVIAGSSGFIGRFLCKQFASDGIHVKTIGRSSQSDASWEQPHKIAALLEQADILVNLAGAPINIRPTRVNREKMIHSRVATTQLLSDAILQCRQPPKTWINASGAHIYGTSDAIHTDDSVLSGEDFFPTILARTWEDAFYEQVLPKTRRLALRLSVVLGKDGGAMPQLTKLAKLFAGGRQGDGTQKVSWIHVEDVYRIILFVGMHETISGGIIASSPHIIDNATFMKAVRNAVGVSLGVPCPALLLRIAATIKGIDPDLVLKSLSVYPQSLLEKGFVFKYDNIEEAIDALVI